MKIAIILPAANIGGPQNLIKALTDEYVKNKHIVTIFYFDKKYGMTYNCPIKLINYFDYKALMDYDIIHSHGIRPDLFVFVYRHKWKAKTVSTIHSYLPDDLGFLYTKIGGKFFFNIWNFFLMRHDKVVLLSSHMLEYYRNKLLNNKLDFVYNTAVLNYDYIPKIDEDNLIGIKKLSDKYILLGSICFVMQRKGLSQIINLMEVDVRFAFILVGDGPYLNELKELARRKGVLERCFFLGFHKNPYHLMSLFDFFIQPSYSEGFPIAVIEAGLMGKPTACTNLPIYKELFNCNELVTFEYNDILSLQNAVNKLLINSTLFGSNLKNRILTSYIPSNSAKKYLSIYEELLN